MDRAREFHGPVEISPGEPKRMVRLTCVPIYLESIWRSQAERSLTSKQEVLNYSISQGLNIIETRRKGLITSISRAQVTLMEEASDLHMAWKIFTGNDIDLSNGPGEDSINFLGFRYKVSCRIAEGITEKIEHYHSTLGVAKFRLYCLMSMICLYSVPRIPDHYKIPMRNDIRTFNKTLHIIYDRVKKLVEVEKKSPKPSYTLRNVDDLIN